MTYFYYLASDKKIEVGDSSIDFTKAEFQTIPGFDYPIQLEVYKGIREKCELDELLQFIHNHTAPYKVCVVQVANLILSNKVKLKVERKSKLLLHEIVDSNQLALEEGHLLTIKKVPTFQ